MEQTRLGLSAATDSECGVIDALLTTIPPQQPSGGHFTSQRHLTQSRQCMGKETGISARTCLVAGRLLVGFGCRSGVGSKMPVRFCRLALGGPSSHS